MLKNISDVVQVIKYDGRQYPVAPGQVFEVKSMAPIGVISDHEAFCLEEKWEKETSKKLTRNASEAPKKESEAPIAKEAEKPQPAQDQAPKPTEKDPDGEAHKPLSQEELNKKKEEELTSKAPEKIDPKANKADKSGGKGKNSHKRGQK